VRAAGHARVYAPDIGLPAPLRLKEELGRRPCGSEICRASDTCAVEARDAPNFLGLEEGLDRLELRGASWRELLNGDGQRLGEVAGPAGAVVFERVSRRRLGLLRYAVSDFLGRSVGLLRIVLSVRRRRAGGGVVRLELGSCRGPLRRRLYGLAR
jgi:hypothetical protein